MRGKGVHAKGNQKRSGDTGGVGKKLEEMGPRCYSERSLPRTLEVALTSPKLTQTLGSVCQRAEYETDTGWGTHMAFNWSRTVKANHAIDKGHKGGKTRIGVQLEGEN